MRETGQHITREGCYKGLASRMSPWKKDVHYRFGKIAYWQGFYNCFFTVDDLEIAAFNDYLKSAVQLAFNETKKESNRESVWSEVNDSFFSCFKPLIDSALQDTDYRFCGSYVTHHIAPQNREPYLNIDFHFLNIKNPSNTNHSRPHEKLTLNIHVIRKTAKRYGDETVLIGKIIPQNEIKMDEQEIVVCVKKTLENYLNTLMSGCMKQKLDEIKTVYQKGKKVDVLKETTVFSEFVVPVVTKTLTIT